MPDFYLEKGVELSYEQMRAFAKMVMAECFEMADYVRVEKRGGRIVIVVISQSFRDASVREEVYPL